MNNSKKEKKCITEEVIQQINEVYQRTLNKAETARIVKVSPACVTNYLNEESLRLQQQLEEDKNNLYCYIIQLFGLYSENEPVSARNWILISQMLRDGISYKEQYLALKYYYEICRHKVQNENKTVGIIPYIIEEAREYYRQEKIKQQQIGQEIAKQLTQKPTVIECDAKRYNTYMEKQRIRRALKGCECNEFTITPEI